MPIRDTRVEIRMNQQEMRELEYLMHLSGLNTYTSTIRYAIRQAVRGLSATDPAQPPVAKHPPTEPNPLDE